MPNGADAIEVDMQGKFGPMMDSLHEELSSRRVPTPSRQTLGFPLLNYRTKCNVEKLAANRKGWRYGPIFSMLSFILEHSYYFYQNEGPDCKFQAQNSFFNNFIRLSKKSFAKLETRRSLLHRRKWPMMVEMQFIFVISWPNKCSKGDWVLH